MQWGDVSFTSEPIGDYLSGTTSSSSTPVKVHNMLRSFFTYENKENFAAQPKKGLLDSRQATINYLLNKFTVNPST